MARGLKHEVKAGVFVRVTPVGAVNFRSLLPPATFRKGLLAYSARSNALQDVRETYCERPQRRQSVLHALDGRLAVYLEDNVDVGQLTVP